MTVALIVAAGSGERLGAGRPKALVELCGRPLLEWSIDALGRVPEIDAMIAALPPGVSAPAGVTAVEGGVVRSESVRRALAAAPLAETVLVHDAARPLVTAELAGEVLAALARDEQAAAAIAAVPLTDTVKQVEPDSKIVARTLERSALWSVQTPQAFRREALQRALDVGPELLAAATDDAWLIERLGGRVLVVQASEENIKVTRKLDLELAELLLAGRASRAA